MNRGEVWTVARGFLGLVWAFPGAAEATPCVLEVGAAETPRYESTSRLRARPCALRLYMTFMEAKCRPLMSLALMAS